MPLRLKLANSDGNKSVSLLSFRALSELVQIFGAANLPSWNPSTLGYPTLVIVRWAIGRVVKYCEEITPDNAELSGKTAFTIFVPRPRPSHYDDFLHINTNDTKIGRLTPETLKTVAEGNMGAKTVIITGASRGNCMMM